MKGCRFPRELLSAWMDGEAGDEGRSVEAHVQACGECREVVAAWRGEGESLRALVDRALGEADCLPALARVSERVAEVEQRSLWRRLVSWCEDALLFHRRALAGVAVAAALGALCAPAVVLWISHSSRETPWGTSNARVVIESMEWENNTRTAVYQSGGGATTLIWVEPRESNDASQPNGGR